jgi:segregation and condensation protein A
MISRDEQDYQVDLDLFRGPVDLLLYLVKRDEVDVRDIPVARILEQFQEYLDVIARIDVERVGDFIVMAAQLMEIKSKMLLPHAEEEGEDTEDPRLELVRQLLQYKRFKDAASLLEARLAEQSQRLPRLPLPASGQANTALPVLQPVELWDLVSAFGRLMRETLALQPQEIVVDQTPLHVHMDAILQRLAQQPRVPFSSLFTPPYTRSRLVGLFLAILELTKSRRIRPEQPTPFGDIWVSLHKEEG